MQESFSEKYKKSNIGLSDYKGRMVKTVCFQSDVKKGISYLDLGHKKNSYFPEHLCIEYYDEDLQTFSKSFVGGSRTFFLNQIETPDGDIIVNAPRRRNYSIEERWKAIEHSCVTGSFVMGRLLNAVKGGFSVGLAGFVGFVPNSQLLKGKSPSLVHWEERIRPFIGSVLAYKVLRTDFSKKRRNIVLSRTSVLNFAKEYDVKKIKGVE